MQFQCAHISIYFCPVSITNSFLETFQICYYFYLYNLFLLTTLLKILSLWLSLPPDLCFPDSAFLNNPILLPSTARSFVKLFYFEIVQLLVLYLLI